MYRTVVFVLSRYIGCELQQYLENYYNKRTELCTDYYDEMIDEVNSLLKELEISARISIPKEVFLKEDDFVGIDLT